MWLAFVVCVWLRKLDNPELSSLLKDRGYDLFSTEVELNGPERFAADNIATEEQCQALIALANVRHPSYTCIHAAHTRLRIAIVYLNRKF